MGFVLVGLSHKTAPIEIREQVFIPEAGVGECVRRLIDHDLIDSGVLLSTCNRTELYAVAPDGQHPDRVFESFGLWPHELPYEAWRRYAYQLTDGEAIAHLFRVASGLDSMILGEGQVLGQIKTALALARSAGVVDARLEIILRGAISAGKRIRHETELGRRPVSVSHAAVAKAAEVFGDLRNRGVLLLGAGPMSEIALRLLRNRRVGPIYLTSRTIERADRLARPLQGQAVAFDSIEEIITEVDIIMSSTGTAHVLDRGAVEALQERRHHRPILIIDMAVPRDIDPQAGSLEGVHLLNIDDLQAIAEANREERNTAVPAAERIIDEELRATLRALQSRDAARTISALVNRVQRLKASVLEQQLARVPAEDLRTRQAMRELADDLTAKFLHGPIRALQESPSPPLDATVMTEAFRLDEDPA